MLDRSPTSVKRALESLPENFRMPVLLADVEGFSYKEIAEIMDTPIGTVMSVVCIGEGKRWSGRCGKRPRSGDWSMAECGPECEETLREIEAFLDGEVDPRSRERVSTICPIATRAWTGPSSAST